MTEEKLIANYPTLYHMAEPGTWPSICTHGLLSTEALLDRFGANAHERTAILSSHRPKSVRHKDVVIRDQKPMHLNKLILCLKSTGVQPEQWFEFLNHKVFLWTSPDRLLNFRRAYKMKRQLIIEVPTAKMIENHRGKISLCHINSGAIRMPHYKTLISSNRLQPSRTRLDESPPSLPSAMK